jgi:hypothetical protein
MVRGAMCPSVLDSAAARSRQELGGSAADSLSANVATKKGQGR